GPDFIPRLTEEAAANDLFDEVLPVSGDDALRLSRELARREGIFVGTSSGATLAAALAVARRAPEGGNIVCMLPDTGERYLSTPLFDGIEVDMDEAELVLSRSTPGYRFDTQPVARSATPPSPATAPATATEPDAEAERFVTEVVRDHGVVMFALEWCEFCWAARKLFGQLDIAYRSVDIDSAALQTDDMGTRIRAVLRQR